MNHMTSATGMSRWPCGQKIKTPSKLFILAVGCRVAQGTNDKACRRLDPSDGISQTGARPLGEGPSQYKLKYGVRSTVQVLALPVRRLWEEYERAKH